jgi:hypothetical protein
MLQPERQLFCSGSIEEEEDELDQQSYPNLTPKGRDDAILPSMTVNRRKKKRDMGQYGPVETILGNPSGGATSTS